MVWKGTRRMISVKWSKSFCSEELNKIENYEQAVADEEHMWECHHRGEILPCGIYSKHELIRHGLYWKRPASELIYLRHDHHRKLHWANRKEITMKKLAIATSLRMRGKKLPDWWRMKLSVAHMGHRPSPESILKQVASLREYYKTHEKKGSKRVVMERLDGTQTIEFASPRRAVEWLRENGYPKASRGNVKACACGLMKRCYRATWRYL